MRCLFVSFSFIPGILWNKGGVNMKKVSVFVILICIALSGCHKNQDGAHPFRLVTGIDVSFDNGPLHTQRHYTASAKIRSILHYLRWIDPYGSPEENPEDVPGSSIQITLTYSDGTQKHYAQKADRYFLEEGKSWLRIKPEDARILCQMLGEMESDSP